MNPNSAPIAASPSPATDNLALDVAAPGLGELEAEGALEAVPVDVPLAVGVAEEAGYVEPGAFISNGCDWAQISDLFNVLAN